MPHAMESDEDGEPANGRWRYSYGTPPHVVSAFERPDRDQLVFVRWTNPAKPGRDKRDKRGLGLTVRNPKTGLLDPRRVRKAEREVQRFHATLLSPPLLPTIAPPPPVEARTPAIETPPPPPTRDPRQLLTLREGFELALHPTEGKYPSTATRRYGDMQTFVKRLFGVPGESSALIEPSLTWEAVNPASIRALRTEMGTRHLASDRKDFGPRAAELLVDAIYSVAAWLRAEDKIPATAAIAPARWRERLHSEWATQTDTPIKRPANPRHTPEEFRQILAALTDPRVDPRIALAIELAAECRTGQVITSRRKSLASPPIAPDAYDAAASGTLGSIDIAGRGKKHGELVMFTPDQRRAVDRAFAGYLMHYEAAFQRGEIDDYWLFPGARMGDDETGRWWPKRVRADAKPLSRDGARQAFQQLETIAGVDHMPGRGWYGLRRIATDLAEPLTTDDRVKDLLGGWTESETRKQIYQERRTDALRAQAADVRRQIRSGADVPSPEPKPAEESADVQPASLALEQRILRALRLPTPQGPTSVGPSVGPTVGPSVGPKKKSSSPTRSPTTTTQSRTTISRERATGLEPATSSLGSWHSTN
jgi:hypothetical protein